MYKSKLLDLIRVLEPSELEAFDKFLRSPYFRNVQSAKEIELLWEHIYSCSPDLGSPSLAKEEVYKVLFPGEPFVPIRVDRVMSNLLAYVKEFIIYECSELKTDEVQRSLTLARFYRKRDLEKPFRKTIASLNKKQKEQAKNKDFYLKQFLIELELSKFESFYNHRKGGYNVSATLRSLNVFYLAHQLEYTSWLLTQGKMAQDKNTQGELAQVVQNYEDFIHLFRKEKYFDEVPLLKAYDYGIRLLQNDVDQEDVFQKLKTILSEKASEIPLDTLKEMQGFCRNFCLLEYNKGKVSYLGEMFALYKNHLEEGYLYYEGGLIPPTIRNIVVTGLRLKEYDWVFNFLEKYKKRIVASNQAYEIYRFNLATYYFATQKYSSALDCLVDRYEDIYYLIAAKRMELKIYYEMEQDILESKIDAFKVYIFRISKKVLPEMPRDANNNFVDILRQIRSSKTIDNSVRIEKLKQKIQIKKPLSEQHWLLEKINEML